MARYRIAWLEGDGIGQDVMRATKIVVDALNLDAEFVPGDIGWDFWCREGEALPERTIELLRSVDCALFGAITSKPRNEAESDLVPELRGLGKVYASPILRLRQEFDLHTSIRPCRAYAGNPLNLKENVDIVVFRENTEGLYAGVELHPVPKDVSKALGQHAPSMKRFDAVPPEDLALTCRVFTRSACRNITRQAFLYAQKHRYPKVTLVEKPNVLHATSGLMVEAARDVAREFSGIRLEIANIDAMCMWLVKKPEDFGILVASNMFGDILSDLCAQIVGGVGFAASANVGDRFAIFEPTHGSAPKYANLDRANPIAMILTLRLMLEWLGETRLAEKIERAVRLVLEKGDVRTFDMGGRHSTTEMARAVAEAI